MKRKQMRRRHLERRNQILKKKLKLKEEREIRMLLSRERRTMLKKPKHVELLKLIMKLREMRKPSEVLNTRSSDMNRLNRIKKRELLLELT